MGAWLFLAAAPGNAATLTAPATVSASSWSFATTPTVTTGILFGDSCVNGSFCVAVGQAGAGPSPLIERWDGTSWTVMPNPAPSGPATLLAVSCGSPTFCVAVGGAGASTLVDQWNGTTWSTVGSPNVTGATSTSLLGVSCTSANFLHGGGAGLFRQQHLYAGRV